MRARYIALLAALLISCGGSGDKQEKDTNTSSSDLKTIARLAMGEGLLEKEAPFVKKQIEDAGFATENYGVFPAQELGKKGRYITYKSGPNSGGLIFLKLVGNSIQPAWHWYFDDMVPDSVAKVETNDDGLWDMQVAFTSGKTFNFIQDESFTLFAKERQDWIAMNGTSSAPVTPQEAMWKCFDGDTATAWRSSMGEEQPYIEFFAPFGVAEGVLSVRSGATDQPQKCQVIADGSPIQTIELEPTTAEQVIKLEPTIQGKKQIRLVFESTFKSAPDVAVAELGLK